jgi:hypothetical protein
VGLEQNLGMICGVGTQLLRKLFLFYLELLVRRMLQLRIMRSLCVASISGACAFLEKRMIGKWIPLLLFSRYCTRSVLIEVVKTNCGGSPPKKGLFKVGSFFSSLACDVRSHFPCKSVWWTQAPPRVAFFAWSAALGKILTVDNLRKRHVIVVDRCCMCKRSGESVDHLLLHCVVAYAMWSAIFSRFDLSSVMPLRVLDLFACWWTAGRPRSAVIWKMVPTCILWCVWKERNDRCFEDLERSSEDILTSFFHTLYLWTVAFVSPLSFTFDEFLVRFSLSS